MPTICIDCRYIGARPSGIGEVVQGLVDHAPRLAPDLRFVLLRNPARRERLSNADNVCEHVVAAGTNSPLSMWFLPEIAPLDGIDLFHATANVMPARLRAPVLTTVHDIMWLTHPELCDTSPWGGVKRAFFAHGIRRALARSTRIAAVSEATRAAIIAFDQALDERTTVTRSGVSERFAPVARDDGVLDTFGLVPAARYVLVVGQNTPYKNHARAVEGFARAFGSDDAMMLVLAQRQGPDNAPLRALAQRLGIADRVRFAGGMAESALIQLYSGASALLHPSLCEGFGNPVAEAMACGCPVVTSDCSAMPEVAGGAARLVDPSDVASIAVALREVCLDPVLAQTMREAGLARTAQLSWRDFAQANVALYRAILSAS